VAGEPDGHYLKYTLRLIRHCPDAASRFSMHRLRDFDGRELRLGGKEAVMCGDEIANDTGGWLWYPRIKGSDAYLNGEWTFQYGGGGYSDVRLIARFRGKKDFTLCAVSHSGDVQLFGGGRELNDESTELTTSNGQPLTFADLPTARRAVDPTL
jgi:hypothetical protein